LPQLVRAPCLVSNFGVLDDTSEYKINEHAENSMEFSPLLKFAK